MGDGQLADSYSPNVQACLARRRQILNLPSSDLLAWASHAKEQTEAQLHGWAAYEPPEALHGGSRGAFAGIPIGVKDVIDVAGMATRAGSRSRDSALPRQRDAEVVTRLRDQGALVCGKTATTEFAYLDPSHATNPFNPAHTPGGSSSGSAAVVGAGVVPLALGTQTAGSVCRPAAWCGTYAFKPSTGRTPGVGVEPFAPSFDTVGVFGLDLQLVVDAALTIIGVQIGVSVSHGMLPSIAVLEDPYFTDISPECKEQLDLTLNVLKAAGCRVTKARAGLDFEHLRNVHRLIMQFEAFSHHRSLLENGMDRIGPHWKGALEAGAKISATTAEEARQQLVIASKRLAESVGDADIVLGPPVRTTAPAGIGSTGDAGLIIPWTYAGNPLVVFPTGLSTAGLPMAVMLAGRRGQDTEAALHALTISAILRDEGMVIDH